MVLLAKVFALLSVKSGWVWYHKPRSPLYFLFGEDRLGAMGQGLHSSSCQEGTAYVAGQRLYF